MFQKDEIKFIAFRSVRDIVSKYSFFTSLHAKYYNSATNDFDNRALDENIFRSISINVHLFVFIDIDKK